MTPWIVAHQGPLSMGFLRQEYWSGLSFPSSGDLPDPILPNFLFVSSLISESFRKVLFSFQIFRYYPHIVLLLVSKFIPLKRENIGYVT